MKIVIGSDHAGFNYKSRLIELAKSMGHTVLDIGTDSCQSVDYPDFGEKGARAVACGEADIGILICGSGIGMDMVANKINGIRSAICWNEETARLARDHNYANILCLGARFLSLEECIKITKIFINTPVSDEERHIRRVNKIMKVEERNQTCNG
ncbi:MAG: ribose 5-phosphate isomerase B [Actinobacteria bacterium]|nr:ribose 5-phosphate isomerase B [Actinomycetota bacterium]MBE3114196.1 ribose 5-phosphate isomerase B [Actinomycetota bacterium]